MWAVESDPIHALLAGTVLLGQVLGAERHGKRLTPKHMVVVIYMKFFAFYKNISGCRTDSDNIKHGLIIPRRKSPEKRLHSQRHGIHKERCFANTQHCYASFDGKPFISYGVIPPRSV